MKDKKRKSSIFTRLGAKLSLLILIITVSADVLSFSARISIDMIVSNGSSDTENIIASVVSSIIIGTLMSFIVSGLFLKPVGALVHNAGSVVVIINSAFLLRWKQHKK